MRIAVLNVSPKGEKSVTMHSVAYLERLFPQHDFRTLHVSRSVLRLERDPEAFRGKPAAVLTSSVHFNDHTAHNYLQGICEDLGMRNADGSSSGPGRRQRFRGGWRPGSRKLSSGS